MKKIIWVVIAFVIIATGFLLYPRGTDEEQIRKVVAEGAAAISKKQLGGAMQHVSRKYKDKLGFSFLAVRAALMRLYAHSSEIDINYQIRKITVQDDSAIAELNITVVIIKDGNPKYMLGNAESPGAISLVFRKSGLDWTVVEVKHLKLAYIPA